MRNRGQRALRGSIDEKINALREEARTGYGKNEVRRNLIRADLLAQREAKEREQAQERQRIKEECLADWRARNEEPAKDSESPIHRGGVSGAVAERGSSTGTGTGLTDGLTLLQTPWMDDATAASGEGNGAEELTGILSAIQHFQDATLPLLEDVARGYQDDSNDVAERRRVLERHPETGMPSLISLVAGVEADEAGRATSPMASSFYDRCSLSALPDTAAGTSRRSSVLPTPTAAARRAKPSSSNSSKGSRKGVPFSGAIGSPVERRVGRDRSATGRGTGGTVRSGTIVEVNAVQGIMKGLKRRAASACGSRRGSDAGSVVVEEDRRPNTARSVVAHVLKPLLLVVCNHCHSFVECDATDVVARQQAPFCLDVSCPRCAQHIDVPPSVQQHYAASLLLSETAAASSSSPPARGLIHSCWDDDNVSTEGHEMEVGTEVSAAKPKKKMATMSCGTGPSEAGATDAGCDPIQAATAEVGCGGDRGDVNGGSAESKRGALPYPASLSHSVKGLYFLHLWDIFTAKGGAVQ